MTDYLAYVYYYHYWLFSYFPFLTYIKMHIFNLSSLFIKLLHMFVLPDVVCVAFMEVVFSLIPVCTELTEILNTILSYKSYFAFFMTSDIYIECINIYSHILVCENYIFWHFCPFLSIYQGAYVNVNSFYIKFLYNFSLPDVASAAIASFTFVSVVAYVNVMLVKDDAANKVSFVLIDASGAFTKTLNLYCITHNTLPFYHIYYIYSTYSYICIYVSML